MDRERIVVACTVEGTYAPHCAAMLHSLATKGVKGRFEVRLMHGDDFSRGSCRKIREMVDRLGGSISFLEVPDTWCSGLPVKGFTGKATWFRVFLAELCPDLDRVLFLDADLIVCRDLAELWASPLGSNHVAAVTNVFPEFLASTPAEIGLEPAEYFNAGVMLLNLEQMRRDGVGEEVVAYGRANANQLTMRDQDALNVVMAKRRLALDPQWNCMSSLFAYPIVAAKLMANVPRARVDPAIRHFEGPGVSKPWHAECPWEGRELYLEHRRATPWPRVRLERGPGAKLPAWLAAAVGRAKRTPKR